MVLTGVNILAQNGKLFPDGFSPDHQLFPNIKGSIRQRNLPIALICLMSLCQLKNGGRGVARLFTKRGIKILQFILI